MAKSGEQQPKGGGKENTAERASRILRNLNAIGAIAFAGAAVVLPPLLAAPAAALAALDAAQAGGFEAARRYSRKKRLKKSK